MGELGALFNPGMRHELEERRARAARREEEGNARDGDLRIDLDSGVAVINAPDGESDDASGDGAKADLASADTPPAGPVAESDDRPDEPPTDDIRAAADSATETAGTTETADDSAGSPERAAPLRPRGKRSMASRR